MVILFIISLIIMGTMPQNFFPSLDKPCLLYTSPDSARISQVVGLEYDPTNYLLMHAMGPNVAGVIGSAVAAGIL